MGRVLLVEILILLLFLITVACSDLSKDSAVQNTAVADTDFVSIETNVGAFVIALDWERSPQTCENWMRYVETGFYDGGDDLGATLFHRVIDEFMVQGGGYTEQGELKETLAPISNEAASSGLSNIRGTVAMARTNDPDSATAQFFINVVDNLFLDPSTDSAGYAVFGTVIEGMGVLDEIASVPVDSSDRPNDDIVILSTEIGN